MKISQIAFVYFHFLLINGHFNEISTKTICTKNESQLRKVVYICSGVEYLSQIEANVASNITELVVINSVIVDKGETSEGHFQQLQTLNLTNCFIDSGFFNWVKDLVSLKHLVLKETATRNAVKHDKSNMTVLDLQLSNIKHQLTVEVSDCNITDIHVDINGEIPRMILSGNKFDCAQDFIWLLRLQSGDPSKVQLDDTFCFMKTLEGVVRYQMLYSLSNKPFTLVMDYIREAKENCPANCDCKLKGMVTMARPQLNVDCIKLNMTSLPKVIPKGSSRCNFSYNLIEDLSQLYENSLYHRVTMFDFTHNHISFLDPVKLPNLLRNRKDIGIWLSNNRMTKFPAKEIKKVYDEANLKEKLLLPQFSLSGNPWICSCDYIRDFQDFIYQHTYDILDAREILCSDMDPPIKVLSLDVTSLCTREVVDTLDIVNVLLVLLLVILIVDFAYNYHQYRKKQKLPWIVSTFKC